jgi:zinc metalloprotease ZmpB
MWSRALWDIRNALGATKADTIMLDAHFSFAPDTTFHDAALATIATAQQLYGGSAANSVHAAFAARGFVS